MEKKIAFLLGAGASDPERVPPITTKSLTEKIIFEGKRFTTHKDMGRYYNEEGMYAPSEYEYQKRILKLFVIIKNYFDAHYSFYNREMNYEDYYYLIDSIHNDEGGAIENPVVTYFSDTLFKTHALLFEPILPGCRPLRLIDLTGEALKYIKTFVRHLLSVEPNSLAHLDFFKKLNEDRSIEKAFIFTLNHDTFIEKYFKVEKIDFGNGFIKHNATKRIWQPESYDKALNLKMNLFKLHGSIDWDEDIPAEPYERTVYINEDKPRYPQILIGSFNKLTEYNSGINFELQYLFWKYLNQSDRLIVSGYSFGDLGINSRIINWLYKNNSRRMIIIHPNEKNLLNKAGLEIKNNWKTWQAHNAVKIINKWIQATNWDEMKKSLL